LGFIYDEVERLYWKRVAKRVKGGLMRYFGWSDERKENEKCENLWDYF